MRRILFVLVAVVALAGVIAYMGPASGQAGKGTRDDLAGKLARREVQRSPLSIPNREMVQVETLIPAGVESGWHVHPGEEVGYIIAGLIIGPHVPVPLVIVKTGPTLVHTPALLNATARLELDVAATVKLVL